MSAISQLQSSIGFSLRRFYVDDADDTITLRPVASRQLVPLAIQNQSRKFAGRCAGSGRLRKGEDEWLLKRWRW
jgi:hypothetical protein